MNVLKIMCWMAMSLGVTMAGQMSPLVLENTQVKIMLDGERPIIVEYLYKETLERLGGNTSPMPFEANVLKGVMPTLCDKKEIVCRSKQTGDSVTYDIIINGPDGPMVEFDVVFSLSEGILNVGWGNVKEHGQYHLIDIQLPSLVSVRASSRGRGWLAIPYGSGRLVDVGHANEETYEYEINWLNAMLCGMVYDQRVLAVVDSDSWEDHFISSVGNDGSGGYATLGVRFIHRRNRYYLYDQKNIIEAEDPRFHLKLQDSSKVMISLVADYDHNGEVSWIDGAKVLRKRIPGKSKPCYGEKPFKQMLMDAWINPIHTVTFEQALEQVKRWVNLTDDAPQLLYLVGWQYEGHDTGYPAIDQVNERLGGRVGLLKLFEEVKKYKTTLSFHDNYDDAYPTSPAWDPDVICKDPKGNLMKGGAFGGRQSYLISTFKYAQKYGQGRVRRTLELYPIKESYHIDVLAGGYMGGKKYDFDPNGPAGSAKNFDGKVSIINEFNKNGVDVTTEDFTGKFVGHVGGFCWIHDAKRVCFRNEEKIPLIPFVYHSKTCYGLRASDDRQLLRAHLYGASQNRNGDIIDDYFIRVFPQLKLYGKEMTCYYKEGDVQKVTYDDGSSVKVDFGKMRYEIMVDGRIIAKDFTSFVQRNDEEYFAYSRSGGTLRYTVPKGWSDKKINIMKLVADGTRTAVPFNIIDGNIELTTEAGTPYLIQGK